MNARTHTATIRVTDVRHESLRGAAVELVAAGGKQAGKPIALKLDERAGAYVAHGVAPGRYQLHASAKGLEPDVRAVEVGAAGLQEVVVLGAKGLPHYYRGRVRVPFEPTGRIGVTLRADASDEDAAAVRDLARKLKLGEDDDAQELARGEGALVLRHPPRTSAKAVDALLEQLGGHPAVVTAGLVLDARAESITFLTRQIAVRFHASVKDDEASRILGQLGIREVRPIPYVPNGRLCEVTGPAGEAVLERCEALVRTGRVVYAEPNTAEIVADLAIHPSDWLYGEQWHVPVVDLPDAWDTLRAANAPGVAPGDPGDLTFGSASTVVAILDRGIQSTTVGGVTSAAHPDFQGNVTSGARKVAQFFDFGLMVPNNDAPPNDHGMGCSGVAGARAGNASAVPGVNAGIVGAAPNCRMIGAIRPAGGTTQRYADAFVWLAGFGPGWTADGVNYVAGTVFPAVNPTPADVISNSYSWSTGALSGVMSDMIDHLTTYGRGGRGVAIFWAAGNGNAVCNYATATSPKVLAIAASSLGNDGATEIRASYSNFGNAIEFCAPSHDAYVGGGIVHDPPQNYGVISADLLGGGNTPGAPSQATTLSAAAGPSAGAVNLSVASSAGFAAGQAVLVGAPGAAGTEAQAVLSIPGATQIRVARLNNAHPAGAAVAGGSADYTNAFGGTSSATPLSAGIAALCLSVNPALSWVELRQILRTTATKIDFTNTNPTGQYVDVTGDGVADFSQWYGWGRLNADAAVTAARDYDEEVDLVVRDNLGDAGAVPSGGWHAASPDIWTDPNDVPIPALAYGSAPPHVTPVRGQDNHVFVRVRNVGTATSSDYWVRALITHYPGFEFRYPQEWTPSNLPGQPVPNPLVPGSYLIGEVAGTGLGPGASTIVKMTWDASLVPDDTVMVGGMNVKWHPCLLAEVAPHDGPLPSGATFDVKRYNNLAHRNITIADPDDDSDLVTAAVAGTSDVVGVRSVVLDRSLVPANRRVFVRVADEAAFDRWAELVRTGAVAAADPVPGTGSKAEPGKGPLGDPWGGGCDEPAPGGRDDGCRVVLLDPTRVGIRCCNGDAVIVHALARTELELLRGAPAKGRPRASLGQVQGRDVVFLDAGGAAAVELPLPLAGGRFVPVVLGITGPSGGGARLLATQRRGDGELSAGYEVVG